MLVHFQDVGIYQQFCQGVILAPGRRLIIRARLHKHDSVCAVPAQIGDIARLSPNNTQIPATIPSARLEIPARR